MSLRLLTDALRTLLACPACRGILQLEGHEGQKIRCLTCGYLYDIEDGIPILLSNRRCAQYDEQNFRNVFAREHLGDPPQALLHVAAQHHCVPVMRKLADEFHGRFKDDQWILDLGIGFGWHWSGATGKAGIIGLDMSIGNLQLAKKLLNAVGRRVLLVCADGAALPIRDHQISGVWSVQVFQHFPPEVFRMVQSELDRVLSDHFSLVIHNLSPAWFYRLVYRMAGKYFHRRGTMGHMELNRYTVEEWNEIWKGFRGGQTRITSSYSELFFHPEFHVRFRPYPLSLEETLIRRAPKLSALFARQIELRIESNGLIMCQR